MDGDGSGGDELQVNVRWPSGVAPLPLSRRQAVRQADELADLWPPTDQPVSDAAPAGRDQLPVTAEDDGAPYDQVEDRYPEPMDELGSRIDPLVAAVESLSSLLRSRMGELSGHPRSGMVLEIRELQRAQDKLLDAYDVVSARLRDGVEGLEEAVTVALGRVTTSVERGFRESSDRADEVTTALREVADRPASAAVDLAPTEKALDRVEDLLVALVARPALGGINVALVERALRQVNDLAVTDAARMASARRPQTELADLRASIARIEELAARTSEPVVATPPPVDLESVTSRLDRLLDQSDRAGDLSQTLSRIAERVEELAARTPEPVTATPPPPVDLESVTSRLDRLLDQSDRAGDLSQAVFRIAERVEDLEGGLRRMGEEWDRDAGVTAQLEILSDRMDKLRRRISVASGGPAAWVPDEHTITAIAVAVADRLARNGASPEQAFPLAEPTL